MNERPYRRLLGYYVLFASIVYVFALVLTVAVFFKNNTVARAAKQEQLINAAHLFREHVDRIFGNVDWIMESARHTFIEAPSDHDRIERSLVALGEREEFAYFVTLTGRDGVSIASSLRSSNVDLRDRAHVHALLEPDGPDLYVSEPRTSQRVGVTSINISRKIYDDAGVWRGIVIVSFDPSRIANFLRSLSIHQTGAASLIRDDGVILARSVAPENAEARFDLSAFGAAMAEGHGEPLALTSPVDGVRRLFAFQKLTRLPLMVVVGVDDSYLDRERTQWLLLSALLMGLLGVAIVGIGFLIAKFIRHEERRQAEQMEEAERLRTAELIESAFSSAGVFVIVFDRRFHVRFANGPARELMLGLAMPIERTLNGLADGDAVEGADFSPTTTHWVQMRDGSMRTICWSLAGAEWVGPDCSVAIGFDRTEAENVERMLNQKARLTSLGEISVGLAHEVAQPLTIINFTVRRMESKADSIEAQKEGLDTIKSAALRAGRILGQIKTFARHDEPTEGAIYDIGECVDAITLLLRRQLQDRGIELQIDPPPERVFSRGDPHLLEQILLNLALNARDSIRSSGGAGGRGRITVSWRVERGMASIRIADNGPGVPVEQRARIFEPFYTTKKGGTGLGLSLSFSMSRQLGGSLSLEDASEGACFAIELPLATPAACEPSEGATDAQPASAAE